MTEPTDRNAELRARNAAMQEHVSSLLTGLQRQTEQLQQAQAEAMSATGRATSPDGLVTVHVNAAGIATDVEVSPSAFKTSTPDKLGRAFLQAGQAAAQDARSRADAALAPLQQDVPDLPDVFADAPSLKNLVPEPPDVPMTGAQPAERESWDEWDEWDEFDPREGGRR
ncbi:YbaB/EbfC family nucleoid-associated protein [Saccharopolyspora sp. HNM0983]|uniref:YbaB/EbfC family nucleoid-associated protein n=1 Tax=Saccharopolyspora montiporae TaxID=2781240 RepID=A0A929B7K0_9PSEU|nr:YbaB/EbfC family nucleoid-associated protein [Saccharopolyspora sp. HNM0983]MBE9373048.1 YbaB/EbfC family nucleoid-associated protein [Saccharopolyspora sp. HNM0983]